MKTPLLLLLFAFAAHAPGESTCCPVNSPTPAAEAPPEESLFHFNAEWTNQDGDTRKLTDLRGRPVLMGMFYVNCATVCPRLLQELFLIEASLEEKAIPNLRVVLVTLDPDTDTVAALKAHTERMGIDTTRWEFWRGTPGDTAVLAAMLGIRNRRMPDGEIVHSAPVILVNARGEIEMSIKSSEHPRNTLLATLNPLLIPSP